LYRILHHNDLNDLLFRIDKKVAKKAFDTLGDLLIANVEDQSQLQAIIEGAVLFKEVPTLQNAGEKLRLAIAQSQTSISDHGNDERQG
jgi:hypothetical protein